MKRYQSFVLVVILISLILLIIHSVTRYRDFREYHRTIAERSVKQVSERVESYLRDRERLIWLFADEHKPAIKRLFSNPEDTRTYEYLRKDLGNFFPLFFAFTLADLDGKTLIEDFDGYVGEICEGEIREFARHGKAMTRIHPNNIDYHFDVMIRIDIGKYKGILFVSFRADALAGILKASEVRDHELWLVDPKRSWLMEVTSKGARIKTIRDDYRMTTNERERILAISPVKDTSWSVVDLGAPGLFTSFVFGLILQSFIVLSIILLISLALLRWLCHEERKRQKAEQARDDFLAVVSHELRTPLTAIKGAAGLLHKRLKSADEETAQLSAMIDRNADKLASLVNDLLDLRKMEAGKMEYHFEEAVLCDIVREAVSDNRAYAENHGSVIEVPRCNEDIRVRADRGRLTQVMTNLLSNAVKYGGKHDTITVVVDRVDDMAEVAVTDHGKGIDEKYLGILFNKFTQVDGGSARHGTGTGLGLSIVRQIVESHGGTVGVQSTPGEGSTFFFRLPIINAH